jgi:hypothetical protein
MGRTVAIRLTDELFSWLKQESQLTGMLMARLIREELESAKCNAGKQRFMRNAGVMSGPADGSARKGFPKR